MSRIRLGAGKKAFVVLASLASGAIASVQGCIPDVNTSGLPPYDGSATQEIDANAYLGDDAGSDAATNSEAGDGGSSDAPVTTQTGTVTGVVLDYAQGNGRGVMAGATVAVVGGPSTTTDAFGVFALANVTPGQVQVNVSKATDKIAGVAYSSTQVLVSLAANQSVSVFPVLHQGCYEVVSMGASAGVVKTTDASAKCGGLSPLAGVFAELQYGAASFITPSTTANFSGLARVEIIPIAFPQTTASATDFAWALALPGKNAPVETIGAAEFRVIDDTTGEPLAIRAGDTTVSAALTTWKLANTTTDKAFFYDSTAGAWSAETAATLSGATTRQNANDAGAVGPSIDVVQIGPLKDLNWLGITRPTGTTTCVTGTVTVNGASTPGIWVHAVGANYFGTGSAVTDSNGAFCVDVMAASGDGGTSPQLGIGAGYVSGGAASVALPTTAYTVSSLAGGTCAGQSGCTVLSAPIALSPVAGECLTGSLTDHDPDASLPATLNVELQVAGVSASQASDGIESTAYIGTTTPGAGGSFCAQVTVGSLKLVDPTNPGCTTTQGIAAVAGGASATCSASGTGCASAGAISFSCLPP